MQSNSFTDTVLSGNNFLVQKLPTVTFAVTENEGVQESESSFLIPMLSSFAESGFSHRCHKGVVSPTGGEE